jgi:hypothetical protein
MNKVKVSWKVSKDLSSKEMLISELMILQSGAGYYIGRLCADLVEFAPNVFPEPYSRESGYYPTKESAEKAMKEGFPLRDCVENNYGYANGMLSLTAK